MLYNICLCVYECLNQLVYIIATDAALGSWHAPAARHASERAATCDGAPTSMEED